MRQYRSRYETGPGKCSVCRKELDCSDSFSIKFGKKDIIICCDCDKDIIVDDEIEFLKER